MRVLLHLTCEITALEKELDALDEADSNTFTRYRLRRNEFNEGWDPKQKELLEKLKRKLVEYGMKSCISLSVNISLGLCVILGRSIEIMIYEQYKLTGAILCFWDR